MAKKRGNKPNETDYARRRNETVEAYVRRIKRIYQTAATKTTLAAARITLPKPDKIFELSDYPEIKKEVDEIFKEMHDSMVAAMKAGIRSSAYLAHIKNDELAKYVLDPDVQKKKEVIQKYFSRNDEAVTAFQNRKIKGLNLSDRVWKLTEGYKNELELALDRGISKGNSAATMARDVKQFLNEPDKLFRRVRNERGELVLSKAAKAYHPGTGTYRSSYKNAERLTRSEINIAYAQADNYRRDQFDFVVGYEVKRSNNPFDCPICGPLARKYPKSYKFWPRHSSCRCHVITILMTDDEMDRLNEAILNGGDTNIKSVNAVTKMPPEYNQWLKENTEKLLRAKNLPYFLKYNNVTLA
jgi:rubrerythrin